LTSFFSPVITWLNKQLNEVQMAKKLETSGSTHGGGRTAISAHGMVRYNYNGYNVVIIS